MSDSKAFNYEQGQFICHVFATISENERENLEEIVDLLKSSDRDDSTSRLWTPIYDFDSEAGDHSNLHLTLLRGHRAVYYHQIKSLVESLHQNLQIVSPICICLDDFRIFNNRENTKQFLCMTPHRSSSGENFLNLKRLKQILRETVDQYATRLTSEDETDDTVAHCSLMYRDISTSAEQNTESDLEELNRWSRSSAPSHPICLVNINVIQIKIGNTTYKINLTTQVQTS